MLKQVTEVVESNRTLQIIIFEDYLTEEGILNGICLEEKSGTEEDPKLVTTISSLGDAAINFYTTDEMLEILQKISKISNKTFHQIITEALLSKLQKEVFICKLNNR